MAASPARPIEAGSRNKRNRARPIRLTKARRARLLRKLLKLYGLRRSKLRSRPGRQAAPPPFSRVVYREDLRFDALADIVHDRATIGTFLETTVIVRPAPEGAGFSGPEEAISVLDHLGMRDLEVDLYGSRSWDAVASATLAALRMADPRNVLVRDVPHAGRT